MKRILSILASFCLSFPALAQGEKVFDGEFWQDQPLPGWETQVHDRIDLMGHISFTTQAPMPKCYYTKDAMYKASEKVTGIPYSGVNNYCGFVGKDISFFTFLSAVSNDQSNMYKVNYHLPPYDHAKAGPFYGEVCTSSANYVWGIPLIFFTVNIRGGASVYLDDMGQNIDDLHLYDGLCYVASNGGHIVVVSEIGRDKDGKIQKIKIFEGAGPSNGFRTFTREKFQKKMFDELDAHIYRYDHKKWGNLAKLAPFIENGPSVDYKFNSDLSPENGERVTIPEGKPVNLCILTDKYKRIKLYRNGKLYERRPVSEKGTISFDRLPTGLYTACLASFGKSSSSVEFQVVPAECKAWYEDGQLMIGGCLEGVAPQGVYSCDYVIARLVQKVADDKWAVVPNIPEGSVKEIKVNLIGEYGGYWATVIRLGD